MTPKEKAEELLTSYAEINVSTLGCGAEEGNPCIISNVMFKQSAKQCALIAVDEILKTKGVTGDDSIDNETYMYLEDYEQINLQYWQEVKTEISKL